MTIFHKTITIAMGAFICFLLAGCIASIDKALPYDELPEITVATEVKLVASPAHPTAYLSSVAIAAGEQVQVIGTDENAAWLLVLHNGQLGWMPTVFSRTNVGTIQSAIIFEPLSTDCTTYVDATTDLAEEWTSTTSGSLLVLGSLYRPETATAFRDAALAIEIDGGGTVVDADYVHTPLTSSSAIVLFAYLVNDMQKGDLIRFQVEDSSHEPLSFQATYFNYECRADLKQLPIGTLKTLAPSSTSAEIDAMPQAVPVEKPPVITHGTYIWSVRSANIDDAAAILVNGEMVAGGIYWDGPGQTDWVDITAHVTPGQDTEITLISLNGIAIGTWEFFIRRGETIIWGQEDENSAEHIVQYAKTIIINTEGEVEEIAPASAPNSSLSGEWLVQVQDMDDIGIVLVNGQPAGGAFFCRNCKPDERPRATSIDIGPWLDANQENQISMTAWNNGGPFSYSFALERDGETIWQQDKSGEADTGIVLSEQITITVEGEFQLASSLPVTATVGDQRAESIPMVDNECNVVPAERCIPADAPFDGWAVGVLKQLTSGDSWAVFEAADPTIIFYEGKFHLWFAGRSNQEGNFAIGYATSVNGVDWEVHPSPVLLAGEVGSWEGVGVASPNVIIKDGQFEMFYLGFQNNQSSNIGLATSQDGIRWEKSQRNPVLSPNPRLEWMSYSIRDPSVIYNGQIYQMWFAGVDNLNWQGNWQLGYAESEDGINWGMVVEQPVLTLGSQSSWKSNALMAPDVLLIDDIYHIWYTGRNNAQNSDWRIGHATSVNGLTWHEDLNNPVFGLGPIDGFASSFVAHPTLAVSNEGYHLWYSGARATPSGQQIGLATSKDGVRWLR